MTTEKATGHRRLDPFFSKLLLLSGDTRLYVPNSTSQLLILPGRDGNTLFEFSFQMPPVQRLGRATPQNI
jgi:hypothetical protein